jgi:hypothetical protein
MNQQLNDYNSANIVILGISGGNGLGNVNTSKIKKVYGIDANRKYLKVCRDRYPELTGVLELLCCDLNNTNITLPNSDILICNLIIEYLGMDRFLELVKNNKKYINIVSCVIQKNNSNSFVSSSGLESAFEPISTIHHDINADELINAFSKISFNCIKYVDYPLPNGKEFIRMDYGTKID